MKHKHTIEVDHSKCIGCGLCKKDCPAYNIEIIEKKAHIITQSCIMCGHCEAVCPKAAVKLTGFENSGKEVKEPVRLFPEKLLAAIETRRTIRQFTKKEIEPEILSKIIEAGRLTPSGENAQNVSFIVLQKDIARFEQPAVRLFRRLLPFMKLVNPIAKRTNIDDHFFFKQAPAVIVVAAKDEINGALAAANMELMAESFGLGVLFSGFFCMAVKYSRTLRKMLGLQRKEKAVMTLVLGYPAVKYHRTAPKEEADIRYY